MRISVSGAQCTGKSTLIEALSKELPDYVVQAESVRYLTKKYGFNIDEPTSDLQLALLNLQTRALYENQNILLDRSFVDSTSYMIYYKQKETREKTFSPKHLISDEAYDFIKTSAKELSQRVDLFVFLEPEFELIDDGFRIIDEVQQKQITEIMEQLFEEFGVDYKVIRPTGSVKERVEQVLFYMKNF